MPFRAVRFVLIPMLLAGGVFAAGCGGILKPEYEYEEEIYLDLDGSAVVNVNASVAALVALRGMNLRTDPAARVDRATVRSHFEGPGVQVTRVSLSRRDGRRFVHVGLDVEDVRQLHQVAPFAWSSYSFARAGDVFEYRQVVGAAAATRVGDVGWDGSELVAFRMHVPSVIPFHNAPEPPQRGNIVVWEQPLAARLQGEPLELQVHMEPESILYSTLVLFGTTILAVAATFGAVIWWIARRGRDMAIAESAR
jgi:hypothetical protein